MISPKEIVRLLEQSADPSWTTEYADWLVARVSLQRQCDRDAWVAVRGARPPFLAEVSIKHYDTDDELDQDDEPAPGAWFDVRLRKVEADGQLRLFSSGKMQPLAERPNVDAVLLADLEPGQEFRTARSVFMPWTEPPPVLQPCSTDRIDPRRIARDFTGAASVPDDLRPWLQRECPAHDSDAYRTWRAMTGRRLLASLADQVSLRDGATVYHFNGPPVAERALGDEDILAALPAIVDGATWVFDRTIDADARHALLGAEWARRFETAHPIELGAGCLDSARAAFDAYVKSGSKETLKALADLRKAVAEETQKATEKAQDLAGALWRDAAVAALPFAIKALPAQAGSSAAIPGWVAVATALFLVFSCWLQGRINGRFFEAQAASRHLWQETLRRVLSKDEVDAIGEKPVRDSVGDYQDVQNSVRFAYAVLVTILLAFAVLTLAPTVRTAGHA